MPDRPFDRRTPHVETFDDGPGGWLAWRPGSRTPSRLEECSIVPEIQAGAFMSRSPWFVHSNHAPPGAGYLHVLAFLLTHPDDVPAHGRPNHFTDGGFSRDLRNARLTVRLRGQVDRCGSDLLLLVQARLATTTANYILTVQPFHIRPEWTEETVTLSTNPTEWTCLGARHELLDYYCCGDIVDVLSDVNVDYDIKWDVLPWGWIEFDIIRIDYPLAEPA